MVLPKMDLLLIKADDDEFRVESVSGQLEVDLE
jgi:hypothetical protein